MQLKLMCRGELVEFNKDVLEAIALHHHVKILPETLSRVAGGLYLPGVIEVNFHEARKKANLQK